jgi:hypothetical protein
MVGYQELILRLVDPKRSDEALSVLRVAVRIHAAGLRVAFDVPVLIGTSRKRPDIWIRI